VTFKPKVLNLEKMSKRKIEAEPDSKSKRKNEAEPDSKSKRPKIEAEPDSEAKIKAEPDSEPKTERKQVSPIILMATTQEDAALMDLQKIDWQLLENKKFLNRLEPLSVSWLPSRQKKLEQIQIFHDELRRELINQYDKVSKLSGKQLDKHRERSQIILVRLRELYTRMSKVPHSTTTPNAHLGMPPLEKP